MVVLSGWTDIFLQKKYFPFLLNLLDNRCFRKPKSLQKGGAERINKYMHAYIHMLTILTILTILAILAILAIPTYFLHACIHTL